ncbi:MAG: permease-like cell division protein FtsX [Thermoleophilia bacterium]
MKGAFRIIIILVMTLAAASGCGNAEDADDDLKSPAPYVGTYVAEAGDALEIYIKDSATVKQTEDLSDAIGALNGVLSVSYVSKEAALEQLRRALGEDADALDTMSGNPLPASFVVMFSDSRSLDMASALIISHSAVDNTPGSDPPDGLTLASFYHEIILDKDGTYNIEGSPFLTGGSGTYTIENDRLVFDEKALSNLSCEFTDDDTLVLTDEITGVAYTLTRDRGTAA